MNVCFFPAAEKPVFHASQPVNDCRAIWKKIRRFRKCRSGDFSPLFFDLRAVILIGAEFKFNTCLDDFIVV
jgi:hypothetical protein